jgi:prevent-host-death family protein
MRTIQKIGIRELKEQTSEIVRRVREEGDSFEVTYRGRAVALMVPITEHKSGQTAEEFWRSWKELGEEISAEWPTGVSALDAIREERREL